MIQSISNPQLHLAGSRQADKSSAAKQATGFDQILKATSSQAEADYVINPEDKEKYCGICTDDKTRVYYPPDNAPASVKKAWIEAMKSMTDEEQFRAKLPIYSAIVKIQGKGEPNSLSLSETQVYFNQRFSSMSAIQDLYRQSIEDTKATIGGLSREEQESTQESLRIEQTMLDLLLKYDK